MELQIRGLSTHGLKQASGLRQRLLSSLSNSAKIHKLGDANKPVSMQLCLNTKIGRKTTVSAAKLGWHFGILLTSTNSVLTFGCENYKSGAAETVHKLHAAVCTQFAYQYFLNLISLYT